MRKAAGIILIILGVLHVVGWILSMRVIGGSFIDSRSLLEAVWSFGYWSIFYGALFVTGGILCIGKRYWGLCLLSASLMLSFEIIPLVEDFMRSGGLYSLYRPLSIWILLPGALIATVFISVRKKEWQEFSDSVDGKVSHDG